METQRQHSPRYLGEPNTEQFTVETRVNEKTVNVIPIHDPFIATTVKLRGFRHAWNALFGGIKVNVIVRGSEGANRAIMTMDPVQLAYDSEEILETRRDIRDRSAAAACYSGTKSISAKFRRP